MIREHLRQNLWGIVAVFIALSGTAVALPGRNTVDSGDIVNGQVRAKDLGEAAVTSPKLGANAVGSSAVAGDALTGADIDESTLSLPPIAPSGPAGGDLDGTYPDPQVDESGLDAGGDLSGTVADAQLGSGRVGDAEVADRTRRILIPFADMNPPLSLGTAPTVSLVGPGANIRAPSLLFPPGSNTGVIVTTEVPDDRVPGSDVSVDLEWSPSTSATAPSAEVVWAVDATAIGPNEDVTDLGLSQLQATTTATTANRRRTSTVTFTGGSAAAILNGDLLFLGLARGGTLAADDHPGDAQLHFAAIRYTAER